MKVGEIIVSEKQYTNLLTELMEARERIQTLEQQAAWYQRQLFGSKADRILPEDPSQFKIPFAEDPTEPEKVKQEEEQEEKKRNSVPG